LDSREVGEGLSGEGASRIIGFINEKICLSTVFWVYQQKLQYINVFSRLSTEIRDLSTIPRKMTNSVNPESPSPLL
jgi:hypothetical protein